MAARPIDTVRDLYPEAQIDLAAPGQIDLWSDLLAEVADPAFVGGAPREEILPMASSITEYFDTWRDWLSAWETWLVDVTGYEEAPEGKVVVSLAINARSKKDSVEMKMTGANVVQVQDGRISRLELYFDLETARRAAGLEAG